MWGTFSKTQCGLMSVLPSKVSSMSKKTLNEFSFFPSGHLLWNSTTAFQERWHWPGLKHFLAFNANITVQWHMTIAFTGTISDFDPPPPRLSCCGSEVLHKKGQIWLLFSEGLGYFVLEFDDHCLYVKKKVIFPFLASFSLYHSQTTWCWTASRVAFLSICPSSPSLPRQWQALLLWWWMTLCRVAELGGLRWYHLSTK